jgi:hypothetical protein
VNIYTNRPANRISRRARAAERRVTLAAVLLTFSVIVTLATIRRIIDSQKTGSLSEAAALAYAAVVPTESASDTGGDTLADNDDITNESFVDDNFVAGDIIA